MNIRALSLGLFVIGCFTFALIDKALAYKLAETFVEKASTSNLFEISSSRLAEKNSHNPKVEQFAQQMADEHTRIGDQLKAALELSNNSNLQPADAMDAKHQKMVDKLAKLYGKDFDKKYIDEQVDAHEQAVSLFSDYAKNGDNDAIKNFAGETLPTIQQHLQMIKDIKASYP